MLCKGNALKNLDLSCKETIGDYEALCIDLAFHSNHPSAHHTNIYQTHKFAFNLFFINFSLYFCFNQDVTQQKKYKSIIFLFSKIVFLYFLAATTFGDLLRTLTIFCSSIKNARTMRSRTQP